MTAAAATATALAPGLEGRLVEVALEVLAEEGLERLTLRHVARRAGVSHGAPLRHFRSVSELRAVVAARGFRLLSDAVERSAAALPTGAGPRARLAAAGRAYVKSAVANSALFALMFRPEALDRTNPEFVRESLASFEQLAGLVRAAQDAGWHTGRDTRWLAACVWSAVHGLATLYAQGALCGVVPGASLENLLAITQELVVGDQRGETP